MRRWTKAAQFRSPLLSNRFLFFLIICTSCTSSSHWHLQKSEGAGKDNSFLLSYEPEGLFHKLLFNLYLFEDHLVGFLISPTQSLGTEKEITVTLTTSQETLEFTCPLFQGGGAIFLSENLLQKVVDRLKDREKVELSAKGLSLTLPPDIELFPLLEKFSGKPSIWDTILQQGAIQ